MFELLPEYMPGSTYKHEARLYEEDGMDSQSKVAYAGNILAMEGHTEPRFTQTSDLIVTPALGQAVATALGQHRALLLKNHGIVVVGTSVEEACVTAVLLEKAARMQLLARQYGEIEWTPDAEALQKQARIYSLEAFQQMWAYFLRKLQR